MTEKRIVIGSGPSAVGVTHALLERGFEVIMLDVGESIDTDTAKVVANMARQEPDQWSDADKQLIQRADFNADPDLPPKRLFGSTFPYFTDPKIDAPLSMKLYGSRAFGGLSVVWGCALLRASPAEMSNWPQEASLGIPDAYLKIRDLLKPSLGADIFAAGTHLKISAAAQSMWDRYRRSPRLQNDFAVYPTPLAIAAQCKACNSCMYGCVYGYTYSSRTSVEDLFMQNPRFRYINGITVERYRESPEGVEVFGTNGVTGQSEVFLGKQVFLAAGMMGSLRILWNSSPHISRALELRDSSYFLIPGFTFSGQFGRLGKQHGLSHLSVDIQTPPFENKPAHVQLYFNNPAVSDGIKAKLGPLAVGPLGKFIDFSSRFIVAGQGYLHSDFCHRLKLQCDDAGTVRASVVLNPETDKAIDAAVSQFTKQMRKLGAYFVKPTAKVTAFGASKTAGALPHAAVSDPATTDPLGRPFGSENVFVVDMTVMPSISARNHTLTMFANALRIGQAA